jgi:pimeloyl-ACP methyl ester carboxylesterase
MGFSEAGPLPRDANAMVGDMHALFRHARIAPPYVLVGHSIAGLYALLYADRYPRQVAGMVLVDPSFPNQNDTLYAASPSLKRMSAGSATAYTFCYQAALHGRLSLDHGAEEYALCGYPPDVAANVRAQCAKGGPQCEMLHQTLSRALRPSFWAALGSEDKASDAADAAEDLKEQRSYGAMPLIVLTAADELRGSPFPPAENRALQRAWTAGHERLARLSTAGTHSVIQDSGHFIQLDQPAAVTAAVAGVVRAAKH